MADLHVRELTVSYRRNQVLQSVNLDAIGGTITGVVGPNGAGKSTLLKAIVGLVASDRGTLSLDGLPVAGAKRRIAYLAQKADVSWHYPAQVRDIVGMGRYPYRRWRRLGAGDRHAVTEALGRVDMQAYATTPITELSGGQQQRVLVARALAQQATLVLLDEPFVALDVATISLLCRVLHEVASAGASVVVVNHDLSVLPGLCERAVLLSRRVLAEGPVNTVLTDENLAAAYGAVPSLSVTLAGSR